MKNDVPFVIAFVPFLVDKPSNIHHICPQIKAGFFKENIPANQLTIKKEN